MLRAAFRFFGSAQKINKSNDGEDYEDYAWHKTTPDEPIDHTFGFKI